MKKNRAFSKSNHIKKSRSEVVALTIFCVIFVLYSITLLVPFFYILMNSFYDSFVYDTNLEARNIFQFSLFSFDNYINAFKNGLVVETLSGPVNLFGMIANSILYIIITTIPTLLSSLMAAYVMSKYKFKLKKFLFAFVIAIQVIPIIGASSAYYKLIVEDFNFSNKPWLYWLTQCGGFDFAFVLFYGYFNSVSWEYGEAAQIDGASNWQIFKNVMVPQAKPIIVALFITTSITNWNDYTTPFMYLEEYPTLAYGLFKYRSDMIYASGGNMPLLFAGIILAAIPALVIYIIFHKTIMENTVAGGLKG